MIRWAFIIAVTATLSATAEHASSRGATELKRSDVPQQIAKLGSQTADTLTAAGTASVKAIADSSSKALANFSQIASQTQEAGQETISNLAKAIPDPSAQTSDPANFDQLTAATAALNETTIKNLQIQAQAFVQLPVPTVVPTAKPISNGERITAAINARPPRDPNRPKTISRPLENSSYSKMSYTRLPAAYNAPRGMK